MSLDGNCNQIQKCFSSKPKENNNADEKLCIVLGTGTCGNI